MMKQVTLEEMAADLPKYLRMAESEQVLITRQGRPAGVLIGFESEEDWFEHCLENDPRFHRLVADARRDFAEGRSVRLEDLPQDAR